MRMNLYQCTTIDAFGKSRRHVVAPSEQRASEFIKEYYYSISEQPTMISTRRIDETLEDERQDGLDSLLNNAPIGFAVEAAIGWIAHAVRRQIN